MKIQSSPHSLPPTRRPARASQAPMDGLDFQSMGFDEMMGTLLRLQEMRQSQQEMQARPTAVPPPRGDWAPEAMMANLYAGPSPMDLPSTDLSNAQELGHDELMRRLLWRQSESVHGFFRAG